SEIVDGSSRGKLELALQIGIERRFQDRRGGTARRRGRWGGPAERPRQQRFYKVRRAETTFRRDERQLFGLGPRDFVLGREPLYEHSIEHPIATSKRSIGCMPRIVQRWAPRHAGEQRGLSERKVLGRAPEIELACRFDSA